MERLNIRKIKSAMVEKDLKTADISKLIGVSESTFSNKMNAKAPFKVEEILILAEATGRKVSDFFDECEDFS